MSQDNLSSPRLSLLLALSAVGLLTLLTTAVLFSPERAESSDVRTFVGEYNWTDGGTGRLQASFQPKGDEMWKVDLDFDFNGKVQKWKGTAEGSLENGSEVGGTAVWKRRDWVFSAKIEDGVLRGQHTEMRKDGSRYETGSFEISE